MNYFLLGMSKYFYITVMLIMLGQNDKINIVHVISEPKSLAPYL